MPNSRSSQDSYYLAIKSLPNVTWSWPQAGIQRLYPKNPCEVSQQLPDLTFTQVMHQRFATSPPFKLDQPSECFKRWQNLQSLHDSLTNCQRFCNL